MSKKEELCEKIKAIYPDVGECGIDVNVEYDEAQKHWVVDLKKDQQQLRHYLPEPDADACMEGTQCVSLGIEIAQLRDNIKRRNE